MEASTVLKASFLMIIISSVKRIYVIGDASVTLRANEEARLIVIVQSEAWK